MRDLKLAHILVSVYLGHARAHDKILSKAKNMTKCKHSLDSLVYARRSARTRRLISPGRVPSIGVPNII